MRLLLDTHVLLWWPADDPHPGAHCRELIGDERNDVHVSAVTAWEIAIKQTRGKLEIPDALEVVVEEMESVPSMPRDRLLSVNYQFLSI